MDRETEATLILVSRALRFASDHPYAATGILGAVMGSAVTYKVMTFIQRRPTVSKVFTPKVYQIDLSSDDLRKLQIDPMAESRWELPEITIIVTSERVNRSKQLPDIRVEVDNDQV